MKGDNKISGLNFREPREPKIPRSIINSEKKFLESSTMKISRSEQRKELEMNLARKKLEGTQLENSLFGEAREKARKKRLDKKNKRGIY